MIENMNYEEQRFMEGDSLFWPRFLGSDIYKWKPMQYFIKIFVGFQIFVVGLYIYHFCNTLTTEKIVIFFPFFSFTFLGLTALLQVIINWDYISKDIFKFWSSDCAGEEIKLKLEFSYKFFNNFAIVNNIIACGAISLHLTDSEHNRDFLLIVTLLRDNPAMWAQVLMVLYKLASLFFVHIMMVLPFQFLYSFQHMRCQLYLLAGHISHLTDDIHEQLISCTVDEECHRKIKRRLRTCIVRYEEIIKYGRTKVDQIKLIFAPAVVSCALHGIGAALYLYVGWENKRYLRTVLVLIPFATSFGSIFYVGQHMESESESLHAILFTTDWYLWNAENKKAFLMFAVRLTDHYRIEITQTFAFNYNLALSILRSIFSVISLYLQLQLKDDGA